MRGDVIRPILIGSSNAMAHLDETMLMVQDGCDALDAALEIVGRVELDPADMTVGLGGLPNEAGEVECDACVMHGPTRGAGAVAGLRRIAQPSRVARLVMERTDHVMLSGAGAFDFALKMGFEETPLLTDEARRRWEAWRADPNRVTDWIDPLDRLPEGPGGGRRSARHPDDHDVFGGTIGLVGLDLKSNLSGVASTSGLPWKIPGRIADSAVPGAGVYVDNRIGACASIGRGEANLKLLGCFQAVMLMGQGMSPDDAAMEICRRVAENTIEPYLLDEEGRPAFNVSYFLVNKRGQYGAAAIWSGRRYAVHDGRRSRLKETPYLYERP